MRFALLAVTVVWMAIIVPPSASGRALVSFPRLGRGQSHLTENFQDSTLDNLPLDNTGVNSNGIFKQIIGKINQIKC